MNNIGNTNNANGQQAGLTAAQQQQQSQNEQAMGNVFGALLNKLIQAANENANNRA